MRGKWIYCLAFAALAAGLGGEAAATPTVYDFTATAAGGPLGGTLFSGELLIDSASIATGGGPVSSISFDLLGKTFTQADEAFGLSPMATFNPAGDLTAIYSFVVISPARASALMVPGGVVIPAPVTSFKLDGSFSYGIDPTQGEPFAGGAIFGTTPRIPEPASWFMLVFAAVALGSGRRLGR
jgi:hypothetical protein